MRQIALVLDIDDKGFVFDTGFTFRGLTISESPDGFNCVLRAWDSNNEALYCMTTSFDASEGIQRLYEAVSNGAGFKLWRIDSFATSRGGG